MLHFISILIVSGVANYWIFLVMVFVIVVFIMLRTYYLRTSQEIKRLEAVGEYSLMNCTQIYSILYILPALLPNCIGVGKYHAGDMISILV